MKYLALEILLISAGAKFDAAGLAGGLRNSAILLVLHAFPRLSLLVIYCTVFTVLFITGRNLVEE